MTLSCSDCGAAITLFRLLYMYVCIFLSTILINDLHLVLDKCKIRLYVDDMVIFFSQQSIMLSKEALNLKANLVSKWSTHNNLVLNLKNPKQSFLFMVQAKSY